MEVATEVSETPSPVEKPKTADEAVNLMRQFQARANLNQHAMGVLINYTIVNHLAEDAGYTDAYELFAENIQDLSRATLSRYSAVAMEFDEGPCMKYGVTRLGLLIIYEGAANIKADREDPGATIINVPNAAGQVEPKLFADCTVDDMRSALQRLRNPAAKAPLPPAAAAVIRQCRDSFTQAFGKKNRIQVTATNTKGEVIVVLKPMRLGELPTVGAVLMQLKSAIEQIPAPEQSPAPKENLS